MQKSSFVLSSEAWEDWSVELVHGRKERLGSSIHQSYSQNASGDLRGVTGGDGKVGCLCGKAGTSHVCDGSAHSSGCVVNGYMAAYCHWTSKFYNNRMVNRAQSHIMLQGPCQSKRRPL